jgi:hypothetical protein
MPFAIRQKIVRYCYKKRYVDYVKSETLISKHEANPNYQKSKDQNSKTAAVVGWALAHQVLSDLNF